MAGSKIGERLQRLVESGFCSCESASEYADELKAQADKMISSESSEAKSKVFKGLADPLRLRVLGLLSLREMCACEVMLLLI